MRKPKRSPAPWSYDSLCDRVLDKRGYVIAYEVSGSVDGELMAAAPELLELAKAVASGYVDEWDQKDARALIARIEGSR
jgi:hypothetical protein